MLMEDEEEVPFGSLKTRNASEDKYRREVVRIRKSTSFRVGTHIIRSVERPWKFPFLILSLPWLILSIGLADLSDINLAIKTLKKNGSKHICILQCVSSYPSPLNEQNLSLIPLIKKKFGLISGLSDHTTGITAALTSVALGASIVEKHFNLDDKKKTVDSFFSLGGLGFKEMIKEIRNVEATIGNAKFKISKSSKKNLNSRRSIYISSKIKKGEKITIKNIKVVRPSFGLHPKYFKKVLGKKINKSLNLGDRFKLEYISKN